MPPFFYCLKEKIVLIYTGREFGKSEYTVPVKGEVLVFLYELRIYTNVRIFKLDPETSSG